MVSRIALLAATLLAIAPGPVRDLSFEPDERGWLIRWRAPEGAATDLSYELQDRGAGAWRGLHSGPETRLRVLEPRRGPCRLRVRAVDDAGQEGPWSEIDCRIEFDRPAATAAPAGCKNDGQVACLLDRFEVRVWWIDAAGVRRAATAGEEPGAGAERDFGFGEGARDLTVRLLDRCAERAAFGVEYVAHDAAEFSLQVVDTRTGDRKSFRAPGGRDRPPRVRYNQVFESCGR